jgi:hypothetical protein
MKKVSRDVTIPLLFVALTTGTFAGCDAAEKPNDSVENASAALSTSVHFDPNGNKFAIEIKTCDWVGPGSNNVTTCGVDPGFMLVGGGAEVEGATPNALLYGSLPLNFNTWEARSKDHQVASPHRLRAYAIGLHVYGRSSDQLASQSQRLEATSVAAHHPSKTVDEPAGFLFTGGGAVVQWTGPGALLTRSSLSAGIMTPVGWTGTGKDHGLATLSTIKVAAIAIPNCFTFSDGNNVCFSRRFDEASTFVGTGYANASTPSVWAISGIGGWSQFSGNGRLLTKLVPLTSAGAPGVLAQTKDHQIASPGNTIAQVISLQSQ